MPQQEKAENTELTPASDNPWYKLATMVGEISGTEYKQRKHLAASNRYYWNGWLLHCIGEYNYEDPSDPFIHYPSLPWPRDAEGKKIDLIPLDHEALSNIKHAFGKKSPPNLATEDIDFRKVSLPECCFEGFVFYRQAHFEGAHFKESASFEEAHFENRALFEKAHFERWAHFKRAHLKGKADFHRAIFKDDAHFQETIFDKSAHFEGTHFENWADFKGVHFENLADFKEAHFKNQAHFEEAHFKGKACFKGALFKGKADFQSTQFLAETSFAKTRFQLDPPLFYEAQLHKNTNCREIAEFPPVPQEQKRAHQHADAYNHLVLIMRNQNRHDEEMRFFHLEMRAKRHAEGFSMASIFNRFYDLTCGFGYSLTKAFLWWVGQMVIFTGLYSWQCPYKFVSITDDFIIFGRKLFVSFSNSIPVFTLPKHWIENNAQYCSQWHDILSGVQTAISTILLALIILTLRNRFRIK